MHVVGRKWFSGNGKPQKKKYKGFGKGKKVRERNNRRKKYANNLNTKLPKSEQWFISLYHEYIEKDDLFNVPLGNYIPDVHNKRLKYIIEIDGSIHELEYVKKRDIKKNQYYEERGYIVCRIKAYDINAFNLLMYHMNKKSNNQKETERKLRVDSYLKSINNLK